MGHLFQSIDLVCEKMAAWKGFNFSKMTLPHRIHISLFLQLSQPLHLIAFVLVTYLCFIIFPEEPKFPWEPSTLSALLYISSFATHFGTQIWMTFISGIVLFFNLPRKLFGMVQRQLFPKYFLLNTILGFITLLTFILHNPTFTFDHALQRWALIICFICDLIAMVYIVPEMVVTMEKRSALEHTVTSNQDNSNKSPAVSLVDNPQYAKLHKIFRRLHGACAIVNFMAMFCNFVHMYHLAWKIGSVLT